MKTIFLFLSYCWRSWELWQKLIVLSFVANIGSVAAPEPVNRYLALAGMGIIAGMAIFFWVHSMVLPKWTKYKEERNQLLTTIKDSDK